MIDVQAQILIGEIAATFDRARHAIDVAQQSLRRMDELNRKLAERLEAEKSKKKGD